MRLRNLVWREMFERRNQLATSLLAPGRSSPISAIVRPDPEKNVPLEIADHHSRPKPGRSHQGQPRGPGEHAAHVAVRGHVHPAVRLAQPAEAALAGAENATACAQRTRRPTGRRWIKEGEAIISEVPYVAYVLSKKFQMIRISCSSPSRISR